MDISDTIIAKSDQLNAEDLIAGPITVQITGVKRTSDEQPVSVEISGGHKSWKPCKTMRRLLMFAWPDGAKKTGDKTTYDPTCWIGRSVTLLRDPEVKWGGQLVGGIRVSALSDIKAAFDVSLAESQKKKKLVTITKLEGVRTKEQAKPTTDNIEGRLVAIKDEWKKRRTKRNLSATLNDWQMFVVHSTESCVKSEDSLNADAFTSEVLDKVCASLNFEMPD